MPSRFAVLITLVLTNALLANPITDENARPGTDRWQLRQSATLDIAGYASATSIAAGETLRFFVTTASDETFTIEIFRMGWYGGLGGRRMTGAVEVPGGAQPACPPNPHTGLIRCNWRESYAVTIPGDWLSGFYLAKLTGKSSGNQNYVMFVVRDARRADLIFQSMVTTYQAYNNWGGKSLYPGSSIGPQAQKVSFDRPYSTGTGAGQFLLGWEYDMVRFLEREGYDVTYITDIDTHARPELLQRASAFLSVGHDEYWSREMREHVEAARDAGIHLGFFAANVCYWQIRFEDDLRTIVAYKESALSSDPILFDGDPTNDKLATTQWRQVPVSEPEESMIGVMYVESPIDGDIVIFNASHWVFAGTGLKNGDVLPGLLGYEVDAIQFQASPQNLERLAHSPYTSADNETGFSDMTIYTTDEGTIVFATGTIQWSWGLDSYGPRSRGDRVNPAAQQITRNVLDRMIAKPRRRSVRH